MATLKLRRDLENDFKADGRIRRLDSDYAIFSHAIYQRVLDPTTGNEAYRIVATSDDDGNLVDGDGNAFLTSGGGGTPFTITDGVTAIVYELQINNGVLSIQPA